MAGLYSGQNLRLHFPVLDSSDVVVIGVNSLPKESEEMLEILASEAAPLSIWFDFAKAYLSQGMEEQFKHLCQEAVTPAVTEEVTRFFGAAPTYEQTQFHCGLAALNMAHGVAEKDASKRSEYFATASEAILAARTVNPEEQMVYMAQGLFCLAKNDVAGARAEFSKACEKKNNGRENIVGFLALAGLLFREKQYKDALLLYRRALARNPACPAEVRLGIAACHFHLGDIAGATAAFERVLALDPNNPDALTGLAVIKLNSSNVQQGLADGLQLLQRSFRRDPGNVGTLILLSHYFLLRSNFEEVETLARAALEAAETKSARVECHTLLARAAHAQQQYKLAAQHYYSAIKVEPSAPLPHLGLAQTFLAAGFTLNATTELALALNSQPGFFDALKILGQLIGEDGVRLKKTLDLLQSAASRPEADADVHELLGELAGRAGEHATALTAYKKALRIWRDKQQAAEAEAAARKKKLNEEEALFGDSDEEEEEQDAGNKVVVPARLLNNAAILFYRAGDLQQAASLLQEAQKAIDNGQDMIGPHRVSLSYNQSRVVEASGNLKEAEEGYKALLEQQPNNVDCLVRLACIARSKGAISDALSLAEKASGLQEGHEDALGLLAQLHMDKRDWGRADEVIKKLMERTRAREGSIRLSGSASGSRGDAFTQLLYANMLLNSAPSDRKKDEDLQKAHNCLFKALENYRSVLGRDHRNAFAANGVGAVLAEFGQLDKANEIFQDVQAAVSSAGGFLQLPDVFINLANVALAKQDYVTAQRLYKIAMDKLGDTKKTQLLLYLARAYYDNGDMAGAKEAVLKAVHIAPTDYRLRFNAALILQEHAVRTFRKERPAQDPTKLQEFLRAADELRMATRYFQHLEQLGVHRTKLEKKKLDAHIVFCEEQGSKAQLLLEAAQRDATELQARLDAQREAAEISAEAKRLEARKKAALAQAEQEERERKAREALEKQERLRGEWRALREQQEDAEGAGKKKGKKAKEGGGGGKRKKVKGAKGMAGDDEEPSEQGEEEEGLDGKTADELFGSDKEDDAQEKELMAQAGLDSDDEAGGGGGGGGKKTTPVGGRLKRVRPEGAAAGDGDAAAAGGDGGAAELQDGEEGLDDDFLKDFEEEQGEDGQQLVDDEPSQKRARRGALEDSDDEPGGGGGGGDVDYQD